MLCDAKNVLRHLTLISFLYVPIRFYHIPKFCPFTRPLKALLDIFWSWGLYSRSISPSLSHLPFPSNSPPYYGSPLSLRMQPFYPESFNWRTCRRTDRRTDELAGDLFTLSQRPMTFLLTHLCPLATARCNAEARFIILFSVMHSIILWVEGN